MDAREFQEIRTTWDEVLETLQNVDSATIDVWKNRIADVINSLEESMMTIAKRAIDKQKFAHTIGFLKSIEIKIDNLLKRGRGVQVREELSDRVRWSEQRSAFTERIKTAVITNLIHIDIKLFMDDCFSLLASQITSIVKKERNPIKVYTVLAAKFIIMKSDEEIIDIKYFNTKAEPLYPTTNIQEWFNAHVREPIMREMEEFEQQGSGWSLQSIINLTVNFNKFNPMRGSSYVPLPTEIQNKNACINVKNDDDKCFQWAVLSALHPVHHSDRVSEYRIYVDEFNFNGINFPVMPRQITKFEKQNDMSINVYILKKRRGKFETAPLHVTNDKKMRHVNLLLIQDFYTDEEEDEEGEEEDDTEISLLPRFHYVWIKNLSRLVSSQLSRSIHKHYICDRCLYYFHTEAKLMAHEDDCRNVNKCKVVMPTLKNRILRFKNHRNKERVPFIIYADFECMLKPTRDENAYQKHIAFSVGYYLKCSYDSALSKYRSYRGEKPAEWFVTELKNLAIDLADVHANPKPMERLASQQEKDFRTAITCHICEKSMSANDRVRDHCHLTGQ